MCDVGCDVMFGVSQAPQEYPFERDMVRKLCDSYGCKLVKVRCPSFTRHTSHGTRHTPHLTHDQVEYLIESVLALRALPLSAFTINKP